MKTIKLAPGERLVTNQLNRKGVLPQSIVDAARDIVANVRANGDAAVRDYCQRFDGVELQSFRLPQEQVDAALEGLDPAFVAALEKAARQIREFHQREVEQSWFTTRPDGTMLGVKVTPLAAAGIYVPGGRAQYPSTVLMNAIPAKVAGVKRVVMVTPPQKDGLISPYTLAAAKLGGVDEIYMVGGAQAVAALAYGTETIPRVEQSWFTTRPDGTMLGVKVTPLAAAGIYVPGGRAQYPSTVLMNAIPAKVAGVKRVVMVTPPQKDGLISPYTLAAAKLGGVDEIYMVGGAQAVAALAYGTETIPRVDKITGPGNAFVAAAKQIVSGDVGIDMVAGPSEVCVLADATAKPMVVAADLMAQAEHDPLAACYLVTCDEQFAREVEAGIDILVAQSPRAEITRASLDNEGTIVVAADMAAAVEAVNTVAPEHLELHCKDAMGLLGGIRNAGAIFVGAWSSEPLGDYVAGPNHTLPTGGTAMFSNPLSVEEFVKRSSVICYTPEGLLSDAPATQRLAEAEGLWAHALSAALRRRVLEQGEGAVSAESLAAADLTKVAWPGDTTATVAEGVDLAAAAGGATGAVVEGA